MGYLPLEVETWDSTLDRKRNQYQNLAMELSSNKELLEALVRNMHTTSMIQLYKVNV